MRRIREEDVKVSKGNCDHTWFVNDAGNAECSRCAVYCVYATDMLDALGIPCPAWGEEEAKS